MTEERRRELAARRHALSQEIAERRAEVKAIDDELAADRAYRALVLSESARATRYQRRVEERRRRNPPHFATPEREEA